MYFNTHEALKESMLVKTLGSIWHSFPKNICKDGHNIAPILAIFLLKHLFVGKYKAKFRNTMCSNSALTGEKADNKMSKSVSNFLFYVV